VSHVPASGVMDIQHDLHDSSVLQCVAVCGSGVMQREFAYCREDTMERLEILLCCSVLQCVAVCCSMLQREFAYCREDTMERLEILLCCSVLQFVAVCCSVL